MKFPDGLKWITVPVKKRLGLTIDEVEIEHAHPWQEQHRGMLKSALGRALHYAAARDLLDEGLNHHDRLLSDLNVRLTKLVTAYLGITTPMDVSRRYAVSGASTERLLNLLRAVGAKTYVSGPTAKGYLDESLFREAGIRLEYKSYEYPDYPQQFGDFAGTVSILDLIANTGRDAVRYLASRTANEVAVE